MPREPFRSVIALRPHEALVPLVAAGAPPRNLLPFVRTADGKPLHPFFWPMLRQHDGRDFAAIIGLAQVGRAAVTEESVGRRIGTKAQIVDRAHARPRQAM